jgi:proteasome lid subunit RPN8/RPN11
MAGRCRSTRRATSTRARCASRSTSRTRSGSIDDAGWEIGAIYHSHTRSEPYPSQTDVNMARWWPEPVWIIVGLAGEQPDVRGYEIRDGQVQEVELASA